MFAAEGAKVACAARTMGEGDHILEGSLSTTVSEIEAAELHSAGPRTREFSLPAWEQCSIRVEFFPD